ncbi:hypothetical protein Dimus_020850 [Dionaea muscipula]
MYILLYYPLLGQFYINVLIMKSTISSVNRRGSHHQRPGANPLSSPNQPMLRYLEFVVGSGFAVELARGLLKVLGSWMLHLIKQATADAANFAQLQNHMIGGSDALHGD